MSSSVASTSSANLTRKASKNPGLALNLTNEIPGKSTLEYAVEHRRPSAIHSLSNTPELEPDWNSDDDSSEYGDDDDAQYVYITSDSPFYRGPSSPRTSSFLSFTGFPFACDALAEEDPLFAQSPRVLFDEELQPESKNGTRVVVVNAELAENMDSRSTPEWNLLEVDGSLDQAKPTRTTVETNSGALRHYY